jgi:hypothetical protein
MRTRATSGRLITIASLLDLIPNAAARRWILRPTVGEAFVAASGTSAREIEGWAANRREISSERLWRAFRTTFLDWGELVGFDDHDVVIIRAIDSTDYEISWSDKLPLDPRDLDALLDG